MRRLHDLPGVLGRDLPRYRRALSLSGPGFSSDPRGWISLCNRIERVVAETDGPGVRCDWAWGSPLHAPEVWPRLAGSLMRVALAEWPIRFARQPRIVSDTPKISFVFAHAGAERLPQLQQTLQSVYAQEAVPCECIVVDQSPVPVLPMLPMPVTYRHLAKDGVPPGWHKAWAYNVGARVARGSILVFHDGDICVPSGYARQLLDAIDRRGHAAASLQRFLFYLDASDTRATYARGEIPATVRPTTVLQNWKGGTIAVAKDAFCSLGGFDEGFVDWGGEDDEFYDRCGALGHCRGGYLPFVHLWHPPQSDRRSAANANVTEVLPWRLSIDRRQRMEELRGRRFGTTDAPDPRVSYKARNAS